MARHHIEAAVRLAAAGADPNFSARAAVLSAEVALAGADLDGARRTAEQVLAMDGAGPEVRCHAFEIVGRSRRLHDLRAAAAAFGAALATAEQASLPVWRLRALHELGTVDMFERMDVDRLLEARRLGEQMGALSTVAVLDLQLSATFTARWDLERCDAHAGSALDIAGRLRLDQVAAKALALMAGSASMRADVKATEQLAARALAADPADPMLAGFCRASVGMAWFMAGDTAAALGPFAEGTAALSRLPNAEPISIRALWPLIQAAQGDRRAAATLEEVRRLGVDAFHLNRGLIAFAQAVLEGRSGRPGRADAIVAGHATAFANCETWADLARFIAAPRALADGWGEPVRWLTAARERFTSLGLGRLAGHCTELLRDASPNPWAGEGVTDREADVLRLVIAGLANKEIAAALRLSPQDGGKTRREPAAQDRRALPHRAGRHVPPPHYVGAVRRSCSPRCARRAGRRILVHVPETGRDNGKGRTRAGVQEHGHAGRQEELRARRDQPGQSHRVHRGPGRIPARLEVVNRRETARRHRQLPGTHRSYVVSGRLHVSDERRPGAGARPGDAHLVGPGHDAWAVGDEPCVTIDFIPTGDTVGGRVGRCPCGVRSGSLPAASSTTWWRGHPGGPPRGHTTTR